MSQHWEISPQIFLILFANFVFLGKSVCGALPENATDDHLLCVAVSAADLLGNIASGDIEG